MSSPAIAERGRTTLVSRQRAPGAGRPLAALILPCATIGLLLLLSSPGLASTLQPLASTVVDPGSPTEAPSITRLGPSWAGSEWDWAGLADDQGFVQAIFATDPDLTIGNSDVRQTDGLKLSLLRTGSYGEFTHALDGFAARVSLDDLQEAMSSDPSIQAYPDLPVQALITGSVVQIGADRLWTWSDDHGSSLTGEGIVVAVVDTGVDYNHPDLGEGFGAGYKVIGGYDFYNHDSDPMDDNGHGTHVAGIIAANGVIKGVAPGARILAYKTLGSDGQGSMSDVILAIDRAMDPDMDGDTSDRADIISMSLGGQGDPDDPVCIAVRNAVEAGIVVVVAAGNEGPSMGSVASPGLAYEAITVGAVDDDGVLASFSSRGMMPDMTIKPEISAPGVGIYSTVTDSGPMGSPTGYLSASGTSMATPHVSGGAALLLQLHPEWTPSQVKSALITSAGSLNESVWSAGAGIMWLPGAAGTTIFAEPAIISYGYAGGEDATTLLTNSESSVTISMSSEDWFALSADGTERHQGWSNSSEVSPSSSILGQGGSLTVSLSVPIPDIQSPEGYYDGGVTIESSSGTLRVPFGYAVLSRMNVHVMDSEGHEVIDPYGGVWTYSIPDADIAVMTRGNIDPAPPASFLLPSGDYQVFAAGHQDVYHYDDQYLLSSTVHLDRLSSADIYLDMSDARRLELDLTTDEGQPIYVKDFRVYFRHEGERNISFHLVGSDYSIRGAEMFSLPDSMQVFVSDTDEELGISISGFSYSAPMWDFMERNWDHWYEYAQGTSTNFLIEASADLQYLLAWEFDGVDASTPTTLAIDEGLCSVFQTKYDIPGAITNIWGDWGSHRSIGGDAAFYVRRDTDTSLNSFFSGMTRTTYVQGVFSELYFPQSILGGYIERMFYTADYDNIVRAQTASAIYIPDRNFLEPNDAAAITQKLGAGPFYPSVYTEISDDVLRLFNPLLRDQSGAKVGGGYVPSLNLYKNSQFAGIYQLSEYLSRPDAMREISLMGDGQYRALIHYQPMTQICGDVDIELSFSVPSADPDPPVITSIAMSQKFVPGETIDVLLSAADSSPTLDVGISWKEGGSEVWSALGVTDLGSGTYSTSIQTSSADESVDLLVEVADESGNFITYTAKSVSMKQIPVIFELSAQDKDVGYRSGDECVTISGVLTDSYGNPLHSSGAVPLELLVDGVKVGMILDEYVTASSHTHDGSIRFDWHFNPANLFSGPDETIEVAVTFDLGLYEPVTRTFELSSAQYENSPPCIELISPTPGDVIMPGTTIDLEVSDSNGFTVECFLDGESIGTIDSPWDVPTDAWTDGEHELRVEAVDDLMDETVETFSFDIDGTEPDIMIIYPKNGSVVPRDGTLAVAVEDPHLFDVSWMLDDGAWQALDTPYSVDMTGWAFGAHDVVVAASDVVGLTASAAVHFEILDSSVVVNFVNVSDGDVIRSGTPIELAVLGDGDFTCSWAEGGVWHSIDETLCIMTDGWSEGTHTVIANVTNDLGDSHEASVTIEIDDTAPVISLISPTHGAFVGLDDEIWIDITDEHFCEVVWSLWGESRRSTYPDVCISLDDPPSDGYFTVSVNATDIAGNSAVDHFAFALDSSPPYISIDNLSPGQSIAPGYAITFSVEDAFLDSVIWSLDGSSSNAVTAPYIISSDTMSLGWHDLALIATDALGQTSWVYRAFYIDGTAPTVSVAVDETFDPALAVEVSADVDDDYAVSGVVLYHEEEDGTFSSVNMAVVNGDYVATLQPNALWDGMTVYIVAVDFAGNSVESERYVLEAIVPVVEPPTEEPAPSEDPTNSSQMLAMILGALMAITLLAILAARRKRASVSRMPPAKRRPVAPKPVRMNRPATKTPAAAPRKVYCRPIRVPEERIVRKVYYKGETAPKFYLQKDSSWILSGVEDDLRISQAQEGTP